ncbi:sushi domain-containing protein 2 isoform X4 [Scyliorhinus torazame]|uniref:sushi domain-containing protein 2 isoform X4 n=1 Tax=Scyliorhinus torazame TaxID=75743 RepID=UPI003B5C3A81
MVKGNTQKIQLFCLLTTGLISYSALQTDAQNSCENSCGQSLAKCSCHVTCQSLETCCLDYREFCLRISPQSGTLMGGADFVIVGATFNTDATIVCKFKSDILTNGYVDKERKAHCISPLLYENGRIPFELSTDNGMTFTRQGTWVSVHHGKFSPFKKSILVNATKWQYYGTPNVMGPLTLIWNSSLLPATSVNIELWGYKEHGNPYSGSWKGEWSYLYSLEKAVTNNGIFKFTPKSAAEPYSEWEIGMLRLTDQKQADGKLPKYGAGQQCCYDAKGRQILTGDSIGGSTPDRGHDWGSPPYVNPPRVPGFSHGLYDVISFYYCCLWSDHCQYYFRHRPSSGCRTYRPPKVGTAFGDPHLFTFDGANFTFNGRGEYTLVKGEGNGTNGTLRIQGRTDLIENINGIHENATGLTAVAMQEGDSDVIEVRVSNHSSNGSLEVLLNHGFVTFDEQNWMDLKGVFMYSANRQNVTVMFASGAGVEMRARGTILSIVVLLPETFVNQTEGLFGVMNNDPDDDFTYKNGSVLSADASQEMLYKLGASWAIDNKSSLFTYDSQFLLDSYLHAPKHDLDFTPIFHVSDNPEDPLYAEMQALCQENKFCRFDTLVTKSLKVGNATKVSYESYVTLIESLEPVTSCGFLEEPKNGKKKGNFYLIGALVNFTCNQGHVLSGSATRTCLPTGQWSGEPTFCISENILGIVLGTLLAVFSLVVIGVILCLNEKRLKMNKAKMADTSHEFQITRMEKTENM